MRARGSFLDPSLSRMHWPAIVAGAFIALALQVVLGLFGLALGAASQATDSGVVAVLGGLWGLLVPFVATFVGAMAAVALARVEHRPSAMLHGVLVWCVGTVAGTVLLAGTTAGAALTGGLIQGGGLEPLSMEALAGQTAASLALAGLAALFGLLGAILGAMSALARAAEARSEDVHPAREASRSSTMRGDLEREGVLRTREPDGARGRPPPPPREPPIPPPSDYTTH